jgi:hypothetical protein
MKVARNQGFTQRQIQSAPGFAWWLTCCHFSVRKPCDPLRRLANQNRDNHRNAGILGQQVDYPVRLIDVLVTCPISRLLGQPTLENLICVCACSPLLERVCFCFLCPPAHGQTCPAKSSGHPPEINEDKDHVAILELGAATSWNLSGGAATFATNLAVEITPTFDVLRSHSTESALVHGLQRLLLYRRRNEVRSLYHHGRS